MTSRDKSNDPSADTRGRPASGGDTGAARDARPDPKLPHERDESVSGQGSAPQPRVEQAGKDVEDGLVDTGKRPQMDAVYERLKRGG